MFSKFGFSKIFISALAIQTFLSLSVEAGPTLAPTHSPSAKPSKKATPSASVTPTPSTSIRPSPTTSIRPSPSATPSNSPSPSASITPSPSPSEEACAPKDPADCPNKTASINGTCSYNSLQKTNLCTGPYSLDNCDDCCENVGVTCDGGSTTPGTLTNAANECARSACSGQSSGSCSYGLTRSCAPKNPK